MYMLIVLREIMKNYFRLIFFPVVCICLFLMNSCLSVQKQNGYSHLLFDANGKVTQTLSEILKITGIEHDGTLEDIVIQTQKIWLRGGVERFNLQGDRFANKKNLLMSHFKKMNMIDEVRPNKKHYDYALLLGSLLNNVRSRFAYLVKIWNEGVRFDKLVFLTGQRDLVKEKESLTMMFDRQQVVLPIKKGWQWDGIEPQTEADMMRIVYEQAELPEGMRTIPFVLIDTSKHQLPSGTWYRPTTETTVQEWMKTSPQPGSCIAASSQPYVLYQDTICRSYFPEKFSLETVGDQTSETSVIIYLDTLARWLYQEQVRKGIKN